jgi:hypothetical protein
MVKLIVHSDLPMPYCTNQADVGQRPSADSFSLGWFWVVLGEIGST